MKKVLAGFAAALMLLSAGALAEEVKQPDTHQMKLTYSVDGPSYEVTVPSTATIDPSSKTGTATISINKAENLPKKYIALFMDDGENFCSFGMQLALNGGNVREDWQYTIPYEVTSGGVAVESFRIPVIYMESGAASAVSKELTFTAKGNCPRAGVYSDKITFMVHFTDDPVGNTFKPEWAK